MSYDNEAQTLTIVYRGNRGVYRYFEVPPEEFSAFCAAPSKGVYLNEIFKAKQYHYERIANHQTSSRDHTAHS